MSFQAFYRRAGQILKERFPSSSEITTDLEFLLSPHRLRLPKAIKDRVELAVRTHYQVCEHSDFVANLQPDVPELFQVGPRTDAVLMAYDFHTTEDGKAYLVEVNTNASMFLLSVLLEHAHGKAASWDGQDSEELLWKAFQSERTLIGGAKTRVAIVDDEVLQQKMLIEFLMYRDWLKSRGWDSAILEAADLRLQEGRLVGPDATPFDFVYNRSTDFLLDEPRHQALRQAYEEKLAVISPHPWAYALLSDKTRLAQMSQMGWLESMGASPEQSAILRDVLIPTYEMNQVGSVEEIWAKRKNLFFKPRGSHGGKSVYRGSSVSRKVFERMMSEDTIIQEFVPAQSWPTGEVDSYMENWKFDVRFFVYRDQIQLAVARSYQGQVTNFSSRYGGLTAIDFI